jgi:hypothetical protein
MDWIQGDKFKWLADFTYAPVEKQKDDYDHLSNFFDLSALKGGDVIYTHTMYVKQLFNCLSKLSGEFIVVTHNSDENIDETYNIPENVKHWFTTNVNCIHPKVTSIPIGLENDRWFISTHKKEKMLNKMKQCKTKRNLVYVNHNVCTNTKERLKPYQLLTDKRWATIERGKNGCDFDNYLDNMYHHSFMICPQGNGMDTHRTWEGLYMGTIPIEKINLNNQYYLDLPICFVHDWEEITEEFLFAEYMRISQVLWSKEKLNFTYWKNKIKNT